MQDSSTTLPEKENVQVFVHRAPSCWNPYTEVQYRDGRATELRRLEEFLRYLQDLEEYRLHKETALEEARMSFIQSEMEKFDCLQCSSEEEEKHWSWSPLYQALFWDPTVTGP